MKVFIGIPTSEYARHAIFYDYLAILTKPTGTIGAGYHTNSAPWNRNLIIREALHQECSHIFFIDDDMALEPNTLIRLLEHDVDVISGLYLNRVHPHSPIIFDYNPIKRYSTHHLRDGEKGLIEIEACGFGCLLVKTHVFALLEEPYVRAGQIYPDKRSEDVDFCLRLRATDIKIHCDLDIVAGHIGTATFWPNMIDGKWHTAIDSGGRELSNISQLIPVNEFGEELVSK